MGLLSLFKKAGKIKKKADQREEKKEPVDQSVFRIGIYGHKGVGKTVFFTIVYSFSKKTADFEMMALGETQEILEEKYNIMKGKGIDLDTGEKISERRFPPLSTSEQRLNFEVKIGKGKVIPVNTIDYSGELVYIDARGEIKQNLIDYFKKCECVLFFIDPEAIRGEGERSNRISSFTDLIDKLSGVEKKLKIPIGLVITKADELPGFKSSEQSTLIGRGAGYIRALNFAGFLRGVLKQKNISSRPDWKSEIELMLNRLESFFKPLINRTMDYQVFYISSTGNSPEIAVDETGDKIKIPPTEIRPLGVAQPLKWTISRISCYRRALAYTNILKWAFLIVLLVVDLIAFSHIYNQMKVRSLFREISQVVRRDAESNKDIGRIYKKYANNFMVSSMFSDFSEKALEQYTYFTTVGSDQASVELDNKIRQHFRSIDQKIEAISGVKGDTAQYNSMLSDIKNELALLDSLAGELTDSNRREEIKRRIINKQKEIESIPAAAEVSQAQELTKEYDKLKKEFYDYFKIEDYDYLLGDTFIGKLQEFKDKISDDPSLRRYAANIQSYLAGVSRIQNGITIPLRISGASGGEAGYSIGFVSASGKPSGIPHGIKDERSADITIRVPITESDISINLYDGATNDIKESFPIRPGYSILSLDGERIPFTRSVDVRLEFDLANFYAHFKDML
jgi:hypothetical protein